MIAKQNGGFAMELNTLIERISYIRTRANLSARKLSQQIGKTDGYIHHLEQSKKFAPTFETLCDILDVCNTSFEEFFYYDMRQYAHDKQIMDLLRNTSAERKEVILSMLKVK